MEGKIFSVSRNGAVSIIDAEGRLYHTYNTELWFKAKHGRRVTFEPKVIRLENDETLQRAVNVRTIDFHMDPSQGGDWLVLPPELRKREVKIEWCRCGCCGEQSTSASNYCPKCGARMRKTEELRAAAREVYSEVMGANA